MIVGTGSSSTAGGVDADGDQQQDRDRQPAAGQDAAHAEARGQRHGRDREPRQRRAVRPAGERDARGDQRLREHPGQREPVLGPRGVLDARARGRRSRSRRSRAARASTSRPTRRWPRARPRSPRSRDGAPAPGAAPCRACARVPAESGRARSAGTRSAGCIARRHRRRAAADLTALDGWSSAVNGHPAASGGAGRRRRRCERTAVSNADTTAGSNCVPAQRRSSASASSGVHAGAVRAVLRHRVERVADRDDPRAERDLLAAEPVRVAARRPSARGWSGPSRRPGASAGAAADDALADQRVALA